MANSLDLSNYDRNNILAQTALTADTSAGVSSLTVGNTASFSGGGFVLIGNVGSSTAEIIPTITPSSSTTLSLSTNTALPHNFNDFVTLLFGSQLRVYRADDIYRNGTQPPDENFELVGGGTINIVANSDLTPFIDPDGTPGQWYKYTVYNPTTGDETDIADSRAVQAGIVHYASIDQIRNAAGLRGNQKVTDDIIAEYRDAAEKEVNGSLLAVYELPLPQPTNPIVVEIVKNIAAGELMQESYTTTSPAMVAEGELKASRGRQGNGDGNVTGLAQLVNRDVVLMDANYVEETVDEAHAFGGGPDQFDNTPTFGDSQSKPRFSINKIY